MFGLGRGWLYCTLLLAYNIQYAAYSIPTSKNLGLLLISGFVLALGLVLSFDLGLDLSFDLGTAITVSVSWTEVPAVSIFLRTSLSNTVAAGGVSADFCGHHFLPVC